MYELTWRERGRLWLRLGLRLGLPALALILWFTLGRRAVSLLTPFVLALVLVWILNPAVKAMQTRLGGSRSLWSILILVLCFALLGGGLFLLGYYGTRELRQLLENWQDIWNSFLLLVDQAAGLADRVFPLLPAEVDQWMDRLLASGVASLQSTVPTLLSSMATGAGNAAMRLPSFAVAFFVFLLASYLIMADYPRLRHLAVEQMSADTLGLLRFVKHTAEQAIGGYLRAQFILSGTIFFLLWVGFTIIGQDYALLLALLLAILDFIPILGAGTGLLPWAVVCLLTGDFRRVVELLILWGIVTLFRRFREPGIVGNQTGLSPILSLASIYVGMRLAGVWGMILGPVLCLVILNICRCGIFDSLLADLHLAVGDLRAIFRDRP